MSTKINITLEQIKELLPETTSLVYVDYNDSLDGHHDILQRCLEEQSWEPLDNNWHDWFGEAEDVSIDEYKNQLSLKLQSEYNLSEEEAESVIEDNENDIRHYIYDKCDDTVYDDLFRNTGRIVAHYDTGYFMESESWSWTEAEVRLERMKIKKFLGITNDSHDSGIDMMIQQATYGGQLLIYFKMDFQEIMSKIENDPPKMICFDKAVIGIVDHCGGSGDVYDGSINNIRLPFNPNNLFLEKSIKYNWTYSIAGMVESWADDTQVSFIEEALDTDVKIEDSPQVALQKQETEYNKVFNSGGCSAGDMDIRRHRNAIYINDFPCGNKCLDCGTFWID